MKIKIGPAKFDPDVLFTVSADEPPADVRTIDQILNWQAGEHERMLDEAGRLFREELISAFSEFQRGQEGVPN